MKNDIEHFEAGKQIASAALWLCLIMMIVGTAVSSYARGYKVAEELRSQTSGRVDVIITFAHTPTLTQIHSVQHRGGQHLRHMPKINAGAFNVPVSAFAYLENNPEVVSVVPDRPVASLAPNSQAQATDFSCGMRHAMEQAYTDAGSAMKQITSFATTLIAVR